MRTTLIASGSGSASSGPVARRIPDTKPPAPRTPDTDPSATVLTALPKLVVGLALALVVIGLVSVPGGVLGHMGDMNPYTSLFAVAWPWALAAALFVLTIRDHPWVPGAALGLLAGTTGLLAGSGETYQWLVLGLAATALAVACRADPLWRAAGGVLGAAGLCVVAFWAESLTSVTGHGGDIVFIVVVAGLIGLAGYPVVRERSWVVAVAPALLLLDAALTLMADAPAYLHHAGLAGLVVIPLIASATSGHARFAGYVTVAGGILFRANEYVSANDPTFTSVAHVALPLAAAVAAYFSRSR